MRWFTVLVVLALFAPALTAQWITLKSVEFQRNFPWEERNGIGMVREFGPYIGCEHIEGSDIPCRYATGGWASQPAYGIDTKWFALEFFKEQSRYRCLVVVFLGNPFAFLNMNAREELKGRYSYFMWEGYRMSGRHPASLAYLQDSVLESLSIKRVNVTNPDAPPEYKTDMLFLGKEKGLKDTTSTEGFIGEMISGFRLFGLDMREDETVVEDIQDAPTRTLLSFSLGRPLGPAERYGAVEGKASLYFWNTRPSSFKLGFNARFSDIVQTIGVYTHVGDRTWQYEFGLEAGVSEFGRPKAIASMVLCLKVHILGPLFVDLAAKSTCINLGEEYGGGSLWNGSLSLGYVVDF
jgi:hypothetical protein